MLGSYRGGVRSACSRLNGRFLRFFFRSTIQTPNFTKKFIKTKKRSRKFDYASRGLFLFCTRQPLYEICLLIGVLPRVMTDIRVEGESGISCAALLERLVEYL